MAGDSIGAEHLAKMSNDSCVKLKSLANFPVDYPLAADLHGAGAFGDASWGQGEAVVAVVFDGDVHEEDNLLVDEVAFVDHIELFVGRDAEWSFSVKNWNFAFF